MKSLLSKIEQFYRDNVVFKASAKCEEFSNIKSYKINPLQTNLLSNLFNGNVEAYNIAKILFTHKIVHSTSTSMGNKLQEMIVELGLAKGSPLAGMDVEFKSHIDGRDKFWQLKSGPNVLNSPDIKTIKDHFNGILNRSRTNHLPISNIDLCVGLFYGEPNEMSSILKEVDKTFPVIMGAEFWHSLTGYPQFYGELIKTFNKVANELDGSKIVKESILKLSKQI